MTVTIDCSEILSREDFHHTFSEALSLPQYYGKNLDALYDCLTALPQPTTLNLRHAHALRENLGPYGSAAISAITHAEQESPDRLTVHLL